MIPGPSMAHILLIDDDPGLIPEQVRRAFAEPAYRVTVAESGEIPIKPGDIVLIPPNEKHMTRNIGTEPLVLLCFFAEPDVTKGTTEFKSF